VKLLIIDDTSLEEGHECILLNNIGSCITAMKLLIIDDTSLEEGHE
jgi:hypothetical protein